jgi:hypothetical protein
MLRARLGRLLWGWFAGPWSLRIPPEASSDETVPAEVVIVPGLLEQSAANPEVQPDLVQKAASSDEFSHFLNYLTLNESQLARKVAAARSPKSAIETLAAQWPRVVAKEPRGKREDDVVDSPSSAAAPVVHGEMACSVNFVGKKTLKKKLLCYFAHKSPPHA